jgi:hypothetical protein
MVLKGVKEAILRKATLVVNLSSRGRWTMEDKQQMKNVAHMIGIFMF